MFYKYFLRVGIVLVILSFFSCAGIDTKKTNDFTDTEVREIEEKEPETREKNHYSENADLEVRTIPEKTDEKEQHVSPLLPWMIYRYVFEHAGKGWMPVHQNGVPVLLFYDLDENGFNDVFAIYIDRNNPDDAEYVKVSDFSRLYDYESEPFSVRLQLFFQVDGELHPGYTVKLGKKMVIDTMKKFQISETVKTPFSLSINFQNTEGSERTWIFCHKQDFESLTLRETFAAFIDLKDINTDGLIDILHFEKSFEEGIGYETYITWYNWNNRTYTPRKVTNIVRNLRSFLNTTAEYMKNGNWQQIFRFVLPEHQLSLLKKKKTDKENIIQSLFIPSYTEDGNEHPPLVDLSIQNVIFPEILENPFQRDKNGHYMFPLRVRIIAEDGEYLYIARISMQDNPFQNQQFYFMMMNENVYY